MQNQSSSYSFLMMATSTSRYCCHRLLLIVSFTSLLQSFLLSFYPLNFQKLWAKGGSGGPSRMPNFNEEEREELRRILDGLDAVDKSYESLSFSDIDEYDSNSRKNKRPNPNPIPNPNPKNKFQSSTQKVRTTATESNSPLQGNRRDASNSKFPNPNPPSKIVSPNADWRSALREPPSASEGSSLLDVDRNRRDFKRPPVRATSPEDDFSFTDLDYSDFEQAMREEDNAGLGSLYGFGGGSFVGKSSDGRSRPGGYSPSYYEEEGDEEEEEEEEVAVVVEKLLMSGDSLLIADNKPTNIQLSDISGHTSSLASILKNVTTSTPSPAAGPRRDIVILYADPRRTNDEFKTVLKELSRLPSKVLTDASSSSGVVVSRLLAVNCDSSADHRKFVKKNVGIVGASVSLLSDSNKKLMDVTKCRTNLRLRSALFLIEAATGKVIKVWYEPEWDPITTRDLLVEEIGLYRQNPRYYLQSQLGIR